MIVSDFLFQSKYFENHSKVYHKHQKLKLMSTAQKKPHYFTRILDKLQILRSLSQQALQRIFYLRLEGLVPEPPIIKKLFSSSIPF